MTIVTIPLATLTYHMSHPTHELDDVSRAAK
jgi:hypothetical protein